MSSLSVFISPAAGVLQGTAAPPRHLYGTRLSAVTVATPSETVRSPADARKLSLKVHSRHRRYRRSSVTEVPSRIIYVLAPPSNASLRYFTHQSGILLRTHGTFYPDNIYQMVSSDEKTTSMYKYVTARSPESCYKLTQY